MVFLQAHGACPALATRIFKRYGAEAANVVPREPYRLAIDVWGIGFKTADRIAGELGIARDSPQRLQAGVLQTLRDARDAGHTYAPREELGARAAEMLGLPEGDAASRAGIEHALNALAMGGYVVAENVQGAPIVYASDMYAAESRLARRFAELAARGRPSSPARTRPSRSSRRTPAWRWRPSSARRSSGPRVPRCWW